MDSSFLKVLAQARPDPGGGAAAAHSAALGLALLEKVVRLEHQRQESGEPPDFPWHELLTQVRLVAEALLRLQDEDVRAYSRLASTRSQGDPEKLTAALEEAVACPLRIMQQAQEGLALLSQSGCRCKLHLVPDLLVACELLGAAFRGALHIAWANLPLMASEARLTVWAEALSHTFCALEVEFQQVRAELLGRTTSP
jgi:formiminotetrahydrofolate cyclodeaminase